MVPCRLTASSADNFANARAAVARGKADVEAGRVVDAEQAFAELEAYFRALAGFRDQA